MYFNIKCTLTKFIFLISAHDIIIEYNKLYIYIYIAMYIIIIIIF